MGHKIFEIPINKTFSMRHNNNIIKNSFKESCNKNIWELLVYVFVMHTEIKLNIFVFREIYFKNSFFFFFL